MTAVSHSISPRSVSTPVTRAPAGRAPATGEPAAPAPPPPAPPPHRRRVAARAAARPAQPKPGHPAALDEAHAQRGGRLGRGEGGQPGVDRGVAFEQRSADEPAGVGRRPRRGELGRTEPLRRQAVMARHGQGVVELGHALGSLRDGQRAAFVVADVGAGARGQPRIEVAAVARQLGLNVAGARAGHQAGGVPARAAGHAAALHDDRVGVAELGEMQGDRRADDAGADHDHLGARRRRGGGARIERRCARRDQPQALVRTGHGLLRGQLPCERTVHRLRAARGRPSLHSKAAFTSSG